MPPFWVRAANSACHLFILLLLNCFCLSFPLVFGAWCGYDCISSRVHLLLYEKYQIKKLVGLKTAEI